MRREGIASVWPCAPARLCPAVGAAATGSLGSTAPSRVCTQQFAKPQTPPSERAATRRGHLSWGTGSPERLPAALPRARGGPGRRPTVTLSCHQALHPLSACSRVHVLGGHEAAEGDVAGQAGLLPPGGLAWPRTDGRTGRRCGTSPEPEAAQTDRRPGEEAC